MAANATALTTDETRDAAPGATAARRGRDEDSELARVLASLDSDEDEDIFKPARIRPRPVWFHQTAEERAAGKVCRALERYEVARKDIHPMMLIVTAAWRDWKRAEDAWIAALRAGADGREIDRLGRRELAAWADFAEAFELADASVSEHTSAGRRLYDALQLAKPLWEAVRGLLRRGDGGAK